MKVKQLRLENFKRFNDLLIDAIPETAQLVLLIGSNGSGKSSVFDAFNFVAGAIKGHFFADEEYAKKDKSKNLSITLTLDNATQINLSETSFTTEKEVTPTAFYGRTSFRQTPRLTRTSLGQGGQIDFEKDSDRPHYFIDRDNRFENDIEKITEDILKELFRSNQSSEALRSKYIDSINSALINIFGNNTSTQLQLIEIIPPLEGKIAQITFTKGISEIHYNLLSAGEKEAVYVLFNLLIRRALYQNTIYFFDEIGLHLNTKLQFTFLKEITENWIPANCQLWTASHSLGFIEYAKQSEIAEIIDFDDLDFDSPKVLIPEAKENATIYEIAVGKEFLPSLFKKMQVVFVENTDSEIYATIGLENTVFVSENNRNSVFHKIRTSEFQGIVDRDFLSNDDILTINEEYLRLSILEYYSIENYLFHPSNLEEYYQMQNRPFDKDTYIRLLTEEKNKVKNNIIPTLMLKRTEYPYFGEPLFNGKSVQNRFKNKKENEIQSTIVANYLNSNDFEEFYKVFPMKTYGRQIPQRQNISKIELAKTNWFKQKIAFLTEGKTN